MTSIGYATLSVIPSAKGFGSALSNDVDPQMRGAGVSAGKGFGSSMVGAAKAFAGPLIAAFGIGAGARIFSDAVAGASNLSESASKVGVVFGAQAAQVLAAAETSAKAMGLSKTAYLDATGTLGNLLVSLKIAPKAAATMSQQMVALAGDLASFNNVSPEEALDAIRSGLVGETEPMRKFGVNMDDAAMRAQALKMGLIKTTKDALTPQQKVLAASALIMAQTGTAQGDFARTSSGLANQQRILAAQTDDLKTKMGAAFLPTITSVVTFLNTNAGPAFESVRGFVTRVADKVQVLTQAWTNGTGPVGAFKDFLVLLYRDAVQPIGDFIATKVVPAVGNFVQGFKDGTGPGGEFRAILKKILDEGIKPLAAFITDTALPNLKLVEQWITGMGGTSLGSLKQWWEDNKTTLAGFATFITVTLLPVFADMAAKAVASAATQVVAWVTASTGGVTSAASQLASHYVVVGGWFMSAGAAIASGATSAYIWALYAADAIVGAAKVVAAHVTVVGGWISTGVAAVSTGITTGIVWAQMYAEAALSAAKNVAAHVLVAVSGWGVQAAAAIAAGLTTAGVWASQALEAGIGAAKAIGGLLVVAGGWIATAATAMASGVMMAAAWIVGLGPVGWIIGAIVAVGAAFVWLYNNVGWFRDGIDAAWAWIKNATKVAVDWIVAAWDRFVFGLSKIPEAIGAIFKGIGNFITAPFKAAFNEVSRLWNNTVGGLAIQVPDWVPGIGGRTFSLPRLPSLAEGATVLPTPGGTVVRVAEAGRAESVVDTGKLNSLLDRALSGSGTGSVLVQVLLDGEVIDSRARVVYGAESAKQSRQKGRATR